MLLLWMGESSDVCDSPAVPWIDLEGTQEAPEQDGMRNRSFGDSYCDSSFSHKTVSSRIICQFPGDEKAGVGDLK